MSLRNNYYVSSFFWSTLSKILSAIVGFISVPLLLGYYGKAEYGIFSIATACNGYMHLLDLGMNVGAVKFFSQWKAEGNIGKIYRVARTNITFYGIIALINIAGLLLLAFWGRSFFSITDLQFVTLQKCLIVIALFSILSWGATTFNQLLIADKQMAFTMQMQCVTGLLKGLLVACVFLFDWSLLTYFFSLTAVISLLIVPYAIRCRQHNLIDSLMPATYWKEFKVVLVFSLSIFALSLFQTTASQSRPIILSMFAINGAETVAEYRIIGVVPQLIIMIGGTFGGVFLPKTSEMVARKDSAAIQHFAYKWTRYTTIVVSSLCFPFILCSSEVLSAYVGEEYSHLSIWMAIWCVSVLVQMHTTPGNALVLAYGKTKILVKVTSIACILSIVLNAFLCKYFSVGSAVISYFIYTLAIIGLYYVSFYKKLLGLSRMRMFCCFLYPVIIAIFTFCIVSFLPISVGFFDGINLRLAYIIVCITKSLIWLLLYMFALYLFKLLDLKELRK